MCRSNYVATFLALIKTTLNKMHLFLIPDNNCFQQPNHVSPRAIFRRGRQVFTGAMAKRWKRKCETPSQIRHASIWLWATDVHWAEICRTGNLLGAYQGFTILTVT